HPLRGHPLPPAPVPDAALVDEPAGLPPAYPLRWPAASHPSPSRRPVLRWELLTQASSAAPSLPRWLGGRLSASDCRPEMLGSCQPLVPTNSYRTESCE